MSKAGRQSQIYGHRARPDVEAVFHLHPPYSTALACTREPRVLQIHQNSTKFRAERLAVYSDYASLADAVEEGVNIGNHLPRGKDIMLMANHGERTHALVVSIPNFKFCRNSGHCS